MSGNPSDRWPRGRLVPIVLAAAAVAAPVVWCAAMTWVVAGRDRSAVVALAGPSESAEGEVWSLRDLRDYLETRGLRYRMVPDGPGAVFIPAAVPWDTHKAVVARVRAGRFDAGVVAVRRAATAADARAAGPGWGRFTFAGSDDAVDGVLRALR